MPASSADSQIDGVGSSPVGDPAARSADGRADQVPVTMYSTRWCGYCHRLRRQLDREGIGYEVVDIERVPEAASVVEQINNGNQTVPTLVYSDGTAQTNPSVHDVKAKLAALN